MTIRHTLLTRMFVFSAVLIMAMPLTAGKSDKELKTGTMLTVKIEDVTTGYKEGTQWSAPGVMGGIDQGPRSVRPTHNNQYTLQLDTGDEVITLKAIYEIGGHLPDLHDNTQVQYRVTNAKWIQIVDSHGKKFDFKISARAAKPAAPKS
jgi:hypothetical protein